MDQEIDAALASSAVKFVPWAPSWEEGIEVHNGVHATSTLAANTQKNFTETEKELLNRGVPLIVGVKETKIFVQTDLIANIYAPCSTHSTSHYTVTRIPGPVNVLRLNKEGDNNIILEAEMQKNASPGKPLWKITSPSGDIGDCYVISNAKHSSFAVIKDGFEEAGVYFRKQGANSTLRVFDVIIPSLQKETGKHLPIRFNNQSYLLTQAPLETVASDVVKLSVREPQCKDGRWVLMFNGRVKRPSTRNFILTHPSQPSREILLCGKCAVKQFVLDLNWPLSLLQGFGIYLTLFSKPKYNT